MTDKGACLECNGVEVDEVVYLEWTRLEIERMAGKKNEESRFLRGLFVFLELILNVREWMR